MNNEWLTYEETFVKMQYGKIPVTSISKAIGKDEDDIIKKAIELGLEKEIVKEVKENVVEKIEQITFDLSSIENKKAVKVIDNWEGRKVLFFREGVAVYVPEHPNANKRGYVFEHRLIMEKQLGRFLLPKEYVFRKDKNVINNEIENLYIKTYEMINYANVNVDKKAKKHYEDDEPWISMQEIIKKSGYNFDVEKNPRNYTRLVKMRYFHDKAYIYLKNKGYKKQEILKILNISTNVYKTIKERNSKFIYYRPKSKIDYVTVHTFNRIKRKHNVSFKKLRQYYNMDSKYYKLMIINSKQSSDDDI